MENGANGSQERHKRKGAAILRNIVATAGRHVHRSQSSKKGDLMITSTTSNSHAYTNSNAHAYSSNENDDDTSSMYNSSGNISVTPLHVSTTPSGMPTGGKGSYESVSPDGGRWGHTLAHFKPGRLSSPPKLQSLHRARSSPSISSQSSDDESEQAPPLSRNNRPHTHHHITKSSSGPVTVSRSPEENYQNVPQAPPPVLRGTSVPSGIAGIRDIVIPPPLVTSLSNPPTPTGAPAALRSSRRPVDDLDTLVSPSVYTPHVNFSSNTSVGSNFTSVFNSNLSIFNSNTSRNRITHVPEKQVPIPPPPSNSQVTPTDSKLIVRYGDTLRLWARSHYCTTAVPGGDKESVKTGGGYIGTHEKESKRRALFGRDHLLVAGPGSGPNATFTEVTLRVFGNKEEGNVVKYGDVVLLVDQRGLAWNYRRPKPGLTGYVQMKPRHTKGDMFVSFRRVLAEGEVEPPMSPAGETSQHAAKNVHYGDSNIEIVIEDHHKPRTRANQVLTAYKKDTSSVAGGYICGDGKGHPLRFSLHRGKPTVRKLTAGGMTRDNVLWESDINVVVSTVGASSTPAVTFELSNDSVAVLRVGQLLGAGRGWGEILVPALGGTEAGHIVLEAKVDVSQPDVIEILLSDKLLRFFKVPPGVAAYAVVAIKVILGIIFLFKIVPTISVLLGTFITGILLTFASTALYIMSTKRKKTVQLANAGYVTAELKVIEWIETGFGAAAVGSGADETSDFIVNAASGLPPMPRRFLLAEKGDEEKALQRWGLTLAWRREMGADELLDQPHYNFDIIKANYKHYFHLPDKHGNTVYYELTGKSNLAALTKVGLTKDDILRHYVYAMEYCYKILKQGDESAKLTIVLDCDGVAFRDLAGDAASFLKATVGAMSKHYPQRSFKIFILNAPSFINGIFGLVKPMLNEMTRAKISIVPATHMTQELLEVIDSANLPRAYGGTCDIPFGESPAELTLRAFAKKVLDSSNTPMN